MKDFLNNLWLVLIIISTSIILYWLIKYNLNQLPIIEASGEVPSNSTNINAENKPKLSTVITIPAIGPVNVDVGVLGTTVGLGLGISSIVKATSPHAKVGMAAAGLGVLTTVTLGTQVISKLGSLNNSDFINKNESVDNDPFSSVPSFL